MKSPVRRHCLWMVVATLFLLLFTTRSGGQSGTATGGMEWPQWGGPNRNFMSDAQGLRSTWPAAGPKNRMNRK